MKLFIILKTLLFSSLVLFLTNSVFSQITSIKGTITDSKSNETLVGTTVMIKGTTTGTITDFDGNFVLKGVVPGSHILVISFISYESKEIPIEIEEGVEKVVNVSLDPANIEIGSVEVVAMANRESEAMLLLEQKNATGITESIGSGRLSSLGVSDAATATSKITGVTKNEGSGDIYVRGLGDRYLTTTMNGLPIPSDDVSKKNINLNLFSTDIMKNVGIDKTFSTENYGDQASGAINISSKSFSETLSLGVGGKINTNVLSDGVWSNFKTTQSMNDVVFGLYQRPFSTEEAITKQSWNTEIQNLPLGFDLSFTGGKSFALFNNDMKVFATLEHENSYEYSEGVFRKYRRNVLDNEFTDAITFSSKISTTGLANLEYLFDNYNSLNFNSLVILKTTDQLYEQGRNGNGYVFDQDPQETGAFVRDQNLKVTQIYINQLLGSHRLSEKNQMEWAVGFNYVNSDEPNRIRNEVNILDENTVQFAHVGDFQQRKSRQSIEDAEFNGYIKDELNLKDEEQKKLKLNYGANFRMKERDFESLFIGVRAKGVQLNSIDNLDEALLNESLYSNNELILKERNPDLYNAALKVYAGFLNIDFGIRRFSGNVGARYELDQIKVDWDVANYVGRKGSVNYDYNNILPGLNLKYMLTEESSLRLAASKTITLPEFKELAPFEYVSPTGRVTKGNPELKKSVNYNADLKWEYFPGPKELFSVTAFYKQINDPINLAQTRGSSGNFIFENTGEQADVYGLEMETRFGIIHAENTGMPELNFTLNATKMWFSQDLLEEFQYNSKTETDLQGASNFIINAILSYSNNKENEFTATLVGNYSSDKIFALGAPESFVNSATLFNNAIIEKGFPTIDLIVSKQLSERIALRFSGKNLWNPEIEQTQKIEPLTGESFTSVVSSYKKGIELSLGVKINLN